MKKCLIACLLICLFFHSHGQDALLFEKGSIFVFRDLGYGAGDANLNLEDVDLQQLTQLAIAMKKMPDMKVEIMGHTDVLGDVRLNRKLSVDRAESVRNYLVGVGIKKSRIKVTGYGADLPLFKSSNPMNRRVELRITENPNPIPIVRQTASTDTTNKNSPTTPVKRELRKIALVIGNANYAGVGKLKNPENDVDLISHTLQKLNFKVYQHKNLNRAKMMEAIRSFATQVTDADVVMFYYAGHGLQHQGNNYLLPTDVVLKNGPVDLQFETVNVEVIFNTIEYTNNESLNMIVLDACRNNPFSSWTRSSGTGLAELKPPSGSLIAYATSPGSLAFDGDGTNGVYTAALAQELLKPQRLEDVFMQTRLKVEQQTNGSQSPWELFRLRAAYQLVD